MTMTERTPKHANWRYCRCPLCGGFRKHLAKLGIDPERYATERLRRQYEANGWELPVELKDND